MGTLGYGPPGLHQGFQGFGLGYHLGYGYGGDALGPGANGGYPFYGGPGYPHPWPTLRRWGGINPFPFYAGPGGPTPTCPNYYAQTGPLATDTPVIETLPEPGEADPSSGYGNFTGVLPYPETAFAPFTTIAASTGSSRSVSSSTSPTSPPSPAPAPGEMLDERAVSNSLGLDAEPFDDAAGVRGLKLTRVYPGGAAENAGLREGDIIRSINGYSTLLPSHLLWVIRNAAPDRTLKMSVRAKSDAASRSVTVPLP
jgi:hypothetical protein